MKRQFYTLGLVAVALFTKAAQPDSLYKKNNLTKTSIELVYSYYTQDGNNSAVTGGIGTENLHVHESSLTLTHTIKSRHTVSLNLGADFITSASTDRIDYVMSSASLHDTRSYGNVSYREQFKKKDVYVEGGTGFSLESDYFAVPVHISIGYTEPSKMRSYHFSAQASFDDLRWGRINPDYFRPVKLIYPVELRYKEWYNTYLRRSYNFNFDVSQVFSKRLVGTFYIGFTYQSGLLATPFHRVYFNNDSLRVENLPYSRVKVPLSAQFNYFAGARTILKGNYGFYWDNFGIIASSIQLESLVKISSKFSLGPFFRFYAQRGSPYFKPYKQHSITETFYTSDYDLSTMQTYKVGVQFRYAPYFYFLKRFVFDEVTIRYSFLYRSTGLQAHMVTVAFALGKEYK